MDVLQPDDPAEVGRYRLLNRLGEGGMGRVYLGQSPGGRLVAVKLIRAELAGSPDFRRRFAQEVAAARRVSGIFTAPVVDADPDGPRPWLVTAYVPGPSLAEAVAGNGPLRDAALLTLAAGLAEGLSAIHAAGVVHRDLKPSNVLLASDGPRIIDFGISRAGDATLLTQASMVLGSPGFMSPEQAEGREAGPATDIFSLGSVLAFAATGEPPFGTGSASAMLYRVVHGVPSTAGIPGRLRPLVERCLAKDPAARPGTEELLAELGYAKPREDWLAWPQSAPVPAPAPALALAPTPALAPALAPARDDAVGPPGLPLPVTKRLADDGQPAGAPLAGLEPEQADYRRWRQPGQARQPRQPRRGPGLVARAMAGLAALAAVAIAGIAVASHLGAGHQQAAAAAGASSQAGGTGRQPDPAGPAGAADPAGPGKGHDKKAQGQPAASHAAGTGGDDPVAVVSGVRAVVLGYFYAVDHREWKRAWKLGGMNIYPSYQAMAAAFAGVEWETPRIEAASGQAVLIRVHELEISGATQVLEETFVVQGHQIVSATAQSG